MRRIFILLLALVTVISLVGCSGAAQGSTKEDFRVGMECNYAPFNWTQSDNSNDAVAIESGGYAGGYDVEISKLIAKGLDRNLVIVKTQWDGLTPGVTSGKLDAIIAGMSPLAERKLTIDFTDNYYTSELVIVVKKDSKYAAATSLADFSGAKITGQLDTFHYTVIPQIPGVNQQTAMETFPAMIVALESGKIDGYISEKPGAISAGTSNTDLTYVEFADGKGFTTSPDDVAVAVGIAKGQDDLAKKINAVLATISADDRDKLMVQALKNQPLQG
jgi:putative lysine transport system substrate-binding protein